MRFPGTWTLALLAGTAGYGVYRVVQTWLTSKLYGPSATGSWEFVVLSVTDACLFAVSVPLAISLTRRFSVDASHRVRNLAIHILAGSAYGVLWIAAMLGVTWILRGGALPALISTPILGWLTSNLLAYGVLVAVIHGLVVQRRLRQEEILATRLQALLSTARLESLKAQVHPHFLLNTLNTIAELVHTDAPQAERMIVRLGDLLRDSLALSSAQHVRLKRELEMVEAYLDLLRMRHGNRLRVVFLVEAAATEALVPPLILQPIVENSIRHGFASMMGAGTIQISAAIEGRRLQLRVTDDGRGTAEIREGLGLRNTRDRLAALYGTEFAFEVSTSPGEGMRTSMSLPLELLA